MIIHKKDGKTIRCGKIEYKDENTGLIINRAQRRKREKIRARMEREKKREEARKGVRQGDIQL